MKEGVKDEGRTGRGRNEGEAGMGEHEVRG